MRFHSRAWRAGSLLLVLWLALFMAEPGLAHVCPVHDATPSHQSHHGSPASHHSCTCPGACCPGFGARVSVPPTIAPATIRETGVEAPTPPPVVRHAALQVDLPPSVGPPPQHG